MNVGFDTGYAIMDDTFRILGGMDAPWVAIGTVFGVTVVIGISLSHVVRRKAGAGILFPAKSKSGRGKKIRIKFLRTGEDWCARGEELVAAGRYREALTAYDRACALEKKRPGVLYRRGRILFDLGMYDQAWGQVTGALAEDPGHAAAWILKGDILCKKGDVPAARYCYRLAFYLQGQDKDTAFNTFLEEFPDDPISDQW